MLGKQYCILILFFMLCSGKLHAQFSRAVVSSVNLLPTPFGSSWSNAMTFRDNPAVFPAEKGFNCDGYIENKFMIDGLKTVALSALWIVEKDAIGVGFTHFGNPYYNERCFNINYGKRLNKLNIGSGFFYSMLNIPGYDKKNNAGFGFSVAAKISEQLYYGLQLISFQLLSRHTEHPPSIYKAGLGYEASDALYAGIELVKQEDRTPAVAGLIVYQFANKFFARIGFVSFNPMPFFGAGWRWQNFQFELMMGHHYDIGYSPAAFFHYQSNTY